MRVGDLMKKYVKVDEWNIIEEGFHPKDNLIYESIMSLGNGHMGMRGNFEESFTGQSHQGSYIAGVWFPDKTRVGWWKNGYPEYFGKVINATNFIGIGIYIDGEEIDLNTANFKDYYRKLNMKAGYLIRTFTIESNGRETEVEVIRFLSIVEKELAVVSYKVTPLNYDGKITFVPYLDGNVRNNDSNYNENFWLPVYNEVSELEGSLTMRTKDNPFGTPTFDVSTSMKIEVIGEISEITTESKSNYVSNKITVNAKENQRITLNKFIAVTTDRDYKREDLISKGKEVLEVSLKKGFSNMFEEHISAWNKRWEASDVKINGNAEAQQGIRFNLFQLFSTYYGEDSRLNIGPKGFTGEKYGGATYWDTEAYALPLYLSTTEQSVARNLLIYRHNQLKQAYVNASKQGLKGALYPMVTFTGIECHNEWEITFEEIHRNGAIAYAIYNYVNYTGDKAYLHEYGIDVLVGISRFWTDRVHFSKRKGLYMIHGVTGPNEYDNNVNNNWYTNTIAIWTLKYTLSVIEYLTESGLESAINRHTITEEEIKKWKDIIERMYLPYDEELDIFVQHDNFLDKDLMPVSQLSKDDLPINQNWSWDKILRSCFIKQADVLQGLYFFGNEYSVDQKKRNFDFYEPMTVHESSLSPSIYSIIASEVGNEEKAYELYNRTARLDLDNYNNDTEDGLHITSMTGSWLSIVQGFAGMRTWNGELSFRPFLPKDWDGYSFKILFRERLLDILVDKNNVEITLEKGSSLDLKIYDIEYKLENKLIVDTNMGLRELAIS